MPDPVRFGDSPLRLDGLYRRGGALASGNPITYFLRFAADGSVQSAWMRGEDRSGRDGDYELVRRAPGDRVQGTLEVNGTAISFTTTSSGGNIGV